MDKPGFFKMIAAALSGTPAMKYTPTATEKQSGGNGKGGFRFAESLHHNPKTGQFALGGTPKNRTSRCKRQFHRIRKRK